MPVDVKFTTTTAVMVGVVKTTFDQDIGLGA